MNLALLTPGAGGMYCGNCIRDNALAAALVRRGHEAHLLPLYLPLQLDESSQAAGEPVFYGGVSVYLEQQFALFRKAPRWFRQLLASPWLLKWAGGRAARTRPEEVSDLTLSMLRGEAGNQACELDDLVGWLKSSGPPDAVLLSNALLVGMGRRLQRELGCPVLCMLQGEHTFLDSLPEPARTEGWNTLGQRTRELETLVAPSRYYADYMGTRLQLDPARVKVVYNGISLDGYPPHDRPRGSDDPVVGYLARMCPEKGLDLLVEAFIQLRQRPGLGRVRLRIGGSCGAADASYVEGLKQRLDHAGCGAACEFHPNLDRAGKLALLQSLTLFSVPARYGEAFGLYVIESLAAGVPVVLPRAAAFPELVAATGGGVLVEPEDPSALADGLAGLLKDPQAITELGRAGRSAVERDFTADRMAERMLAVFAPARFGLESGAMTGHGSVAL